MGYSLIEKLTNFLMPIDNSANTQDDEHLAVKILQKSIEAEHILRDI